jgi:hypothetical protein
MNIKTIPGLILCVLLTNLVFSQDKYDDEPQVLIGHIKNISGFAGLLLEGSMIDEKFAVSTGGAGTMLLNQMFYFGGYGLGNRSEMTLPDQLGNQQLMNVHFGHGGLLFGYILKPNKLIHFVASSKFGWGSIRVSDNNGSNEPILHDNVFCFTPQIEAEINISYCFRLNTSVGYRLVEGVHNDNFKPGDFNSPTVGISFIFGWFKDYSFHIF